MYGSSSLSEIRLQSSLRCADLLLDLFLVEERCAWPSSRVTLLPLLFPVVAFVAACEARAASVPEQSADAPSSAAVTGDAGLSFVDADVESESNCDDGWSLDASTALLVVATLSALLELSHAITSDSELEVSGFASWERCSHAESLSMLSGGVRCTTLFVGFST